MDYGLCVLRHCKCIIYCGDNLYCEGNDMNMAKSKVSRRIILSAKNLYFFQQKRLENHKKLQVEKKQRDEQEHIKWYDNENYLLGYN